MAAAAGLIVGGVASYAAVQTLREQVKAAAEDDARALSAQARRLTIWTDAEAERPAHVLHVLNRSPDPITDWYLLYRGSITDGKTSEGFETGHSVDTVEAFPVPIPPCTQFTIRLTEVYQHVDWAGETERKGQKVPDAEVLAVAFSDVNQKTWTRDVSGTLVEGFPETHQISTVSEDDARRALKKTSPARLCNEPLT